jgi:chromate transporter
MAAAPVSLTELARVFFRIGWLAFGGPVAQLGLIHDECVERRGWLDDEQFVRALNFVHVLPGPEATQMALIVGWRVRGVLGGMLAGLLFVVPGFLTLTLLAWVYVRFGSRPELLGVLSGFRPVGLALLLAAMVRLGRAALRTRFQVALALAAFAASAVLHVGFVPLLLAAGCISLVRGRLSARATTAALAFSLLLPTRAQALSATAERLKDISWFFLQVGLVSFGGAYAVLPLLREGTVMHFGWVSDRQMVDALALAETTPGPLISIGMFLGYLAGHPVGAGWAGAACAGFWLFLPSFILVLVGAPHLDRITALPGVKPFLEGITAAVVALMASVSLVLIRATVFPEGAMDWLTAGLGVAAFLLLVFARRQVSVVAVVLAGGVLGLIRALLV